jgi:poly-beta-1,6-N-acetyl-D-glucosamine synthase
MFFFFVALFFISIVFILLLGYPFILFFLTRFRPHPWKRDTMLPAISLIIPSHGSMRIKNKILNTLDKYPRDKMQIIVVYSGTDQGVLDELKFFQEQQLIELITEQKRSGKTNALNLGLQHTSCEICVITDSDSLIENGSLENLISPFADQEVGAVSGDLEYFGTGNSNKLHNLLFNKYKKTIKNWESMVDSCSYAPGELLAFRKKLVDSLPGEVIVDDYYLLLTIRHEGYRCVSAPEAKVYEQPPSKSSGTLERTRRVVSGTLFEASRFRGMMFNRKFGVFGLFIFPSYISRLVLLPMFFFLFSIFFLFGTIEITVGLPLLWIVTLSIATACFIILGRRPFRYLLSLFLGMMHGIIEYLLGNRAVVWKDVKEPTK